MPADMHVHLRFGKGMTAAEAEEELLQLAARHTLPGRSPGPPSLGSPTPPSLDPICLDPICLDPICLGSPGLRGLDPICLGSPGPACLRFPARSPPRNTRRPVPGRA
ncbi:MAG: hypothetical protein U0R52_01390 [Solirubrobacterales bacterium]